MKKLALAASISFALCSLSAQAEHKNSETGWLGVYGIAYQTESIPEDSFIFDDGFGVGIEAAYRFNADWALRFEYASLDIELDNDNFGNNQTGQLYGVDALYFLDNDIAYLFGGGKILNIDVDYTLVNLGIGRHWDLSNKLKLITEAATYFGEGNPDFSFKLGLAYSFGDTHHSHTSAKSTTELPAPAAVDSDNDGVLDTDDNCPSTPAGTKVDNNGCAMTVVAEEKDSDADGVFDSKDKCPKTPSNDVVDSDGCTRFGEQTVSQTVEVLFSNNSSEIANPDTPDIVDFANFMKRYGKTEAVIEGHASAPGDADYNMQISEDRAQAFKALLVEEYGIAASRLQAVGYGEEQLLDTSNTAAAHIKNRRIVVNVSEQVKVKLTK